MQPDPSVSDPSASHEAIALTTSASPGLTNASINHDSDLELRALDEQAYDSISDENVPSDDSSTKQDQSLVESVPLVLGIFAFDSGSIDVAIVDIKNLKKEQVISGANKAAIINMNIAQV